MHIGIYGDSFAVNYSGWPNYLKKYFNNAKIKIFAVGGTSTNYSYMKFLETHHKHDVVIFIWSSDKRNTLITKDFDKNRYKVHATANTSHEFNFRDKHELLSQLKIEQEDIPEFDIKDVDVTWTSHELYSIKKHPTKNILHEIAMRDSVLLKRPDSINIEAFSCKEFEPYGMSNIPFTDLCQLLVKLNVNIKFEESNYRDDYQLRPNHLTPKQNEQFANYLYQHVTKKDFDIHKTFSDPRKYYMMSETLEESGFHLDNFEKL